MLFSGVLRRSTPVDRRLLSIVAFVAAVSWTTRELQHQKIPVPERDTWITSDKDSLYHMRRVERIFYDGLAGSDPYLSFPDGSAIPWPPYYTALAFAWTAPGAPSDPARRHDFIERRVASLPRVCGVAASVVAALAANALAGPGAALFAGTSHALSEASITTSRIGNGDHHAFLALLAAAMLAGASRAFRREALADVRGSARRGAAIGLLAGIALGSWVAALLFVVLLQLVLGWLVVRHSRRFLRGLPAFGIALHAAALAAALPAVLASPWKATHPWMVVNLSWFHLAWLFAGGLVFVPLLRLGSGPSLRAYPLSVLAALAVAALLLFALDVGPAAGIREGFAWLRRDDVFMGAVWESRALFGKPFDPFAILGFEVLVLPFAWAALAALAFARSRFELLPWAVAVPVQFAQAARQARFSDLLVVPMAVTVAWGIVAAWNARPLAPLRARVNARGRAGDLGIVVLLVALVAADQAKSIAATRAALGRDPSASGRREQPGEAVVRELAEWLRAHTPATSSYSVLASWTWGHVIEWAGDRPTVATNFGTFVGEDAFRDPARFFLSEDPRKAEAILAKHRSRYVLVESWLPNQLDPLLRAAGVDRSRYVETGSAQDLALRFEWYGTLGARLLLEGRALGSDGVWGESLDFLRAVHLSPTRDSRYRMARQTPPAGWIWERVPGAVVEARGAMGDTLIVEIDVHYAPTQYDLAWSRGAVAGANGVARIRVPYATDAANGEGVATGPSRWRFGRREGTLAIPESAVLERRVVPVGPEGR